jgi:iron complex transport system ATP-binding protein
VALGRFAYGGLPSRLSTDDIAAIEDALAAVDLCAFVGRSAATLSGGEFARLMAAKTLAAHTHYILFDEPTASLDPLHQHRIMSALKDRSKEGAGVAVVMHDLSLAASYADRMVLMQDGCIAADGSPEDIMTPDLLQGAYGITPMVTPHGVHFPKG